MMTETLPTDEKISSHSSPPDLKELFSRDVLNGFRSSQKRLSSVYFYDERGSQLFESICELDEYYLTRKETEILQRHSKEIIGLLARNTHLVELGSGSSSKTQILLEAALAQFETVRYSPIDVSEEILTETAADLKQRYPRLEIEACAGLYEAGIAQILGNDASADCIMWLGSSIGNMTRPEAGAFLADISKQMCSDDRLLLGIDLRKSAKILEPAYDDALGVTADFNLNLLERINSELGGHFKLDQFRHRAVYQELEGRIEMYLDSVLDQEVTIDDLYTSISFKQDEPILTEYSHKYSQSEILELAHAANCQLEKQWLDAAGWYSLNLLKPNLTKS